jgi:hypothetical protein
MRKFNSPSVEILEPDSNAKSEKRWQPQEQDFEILLSVDEGIQSDRSDQQPANADSPSVVSLAPDSNGKSEK